MIMNVYEHDVVGCLCAHVDLVGHMSRYIPYEVVEVTSVGEDSWDDAGLDAIFHLIKVRLSQDKMTEAAEEARRACPELFA